MPFFILVLFYALGALLFTFIAIQLNKIHKWVTIKDLTNPYDGDMLKLILFVMILIWPISIIAIGISKCVYLFIEFCQNYIPKE